MCGIFFSCSRKVHECPSDRLLECLNKRGPDSICTIKRALDSENASSQGLPSEQRKQSYFLTFLSTVLSLRGDGVTRQPLEDLDSGSLLCWNGEAWKAGNEVIDGNDSQRVFDLFLKAIQYLEPTSSNTPFSYDQYMESIIDAVASISGPYSFVFYDAPHQRIFFGRDTLGRRSLAIKNGLPESISISSICDCTDTGNWTEVEADGIYMLDLQTASPSPEDEAEEITFIPRILSGSNTELRYTLVRLNPPLLLLKTLTNARHRHSHFSITTIRVLRVRL